MATCRARGGLGAEGLLCERASGHHGDHSMGLVTWHSPDPIAAAIPLAPQPLTEQRVREIAREVLEGAEGMRAVRAAVIALDILTSDAIGGES